MLKAVLAMAVAFWAYSCTFLTSVSGSPGVSAPASTSLVGAGGWGPWVRAPHPVYAPQHPEAHPLPPAAALARPLLAPATRTVVQTSPSRSDAFMAGERAEHMVWGGRQGATRPWGS